MVYCILCKYTFAKFKYRIYIKLQEKKEVIMKRYLNKVLCISMIALSLCGCNKTNNDVEASAAADGPKTAKEVLEKSVEYYKGQTIKSLSAVARLKV